MDYLVRFHKWKKQHYFYIFMESKSWYFHEATTFLNTEKWLPSNTGWHMAGTLIGWSDLTQVCVTTASSRSESRNLNICFIICIKSPSVMRHLWAHRSFDTNSLLESKNHKVWFIYVILIGNYKPRITNQRERSLKGNVFNMFCHNNQEWLVLNANVALHL